MNRKIVYMIWLALVVAFGGRATAWTGVTVGDDAPLGAESFDPATGTWTIEGDGHDIWDNADDFHYVYKYLLGDGSISVRILEWGDGSNTWAKAGVMMRETLAAESVHAMMVVTAGDGGGGAFQRRTATGGGSESNHDPSPNVAPGWYVKVERTGDEFRGYLSQDGITWTQHGPAVTIVMRNATGTKAACHIGLCVTSHAAGELRTATLDSVVLEGEIFDAPPPQLEAYEPVPADGTTSVIAPLLQWATGDTALWHKVYLGTSPELTEANVVAPRHPLTLYFHVPGLEPGTMYYWRVDEVELDGTIHTGPVWNFTAAPLTAFEPAPTPGAKFQGPDVDLAWTAGATAVTHDVYLGTGEEDVVAGAEAVFRGNQIETTFDPGVLALDTTYYWRVDEIDSTGAAQRGEVWSFRTTVPGLGSVRREIWENIEGTSLDALRDDPRFPSLPTVEDELPDFDAPEHGDNYGGRLQAWLHVPVAGEYTFWVAGDDNTELYLGPDPDRAQLIAGVPSWTPALAWDTLPQQKSALIFLEADRYYLAALWKEGGGGDHCAAAWQGPGVPQRTLIGGSYLKSFEVLWAFGPNPRDGAADVTQTPMLRWSAGVRALRHDVYFGDGEQAVADADTSTTGIYRGRQTLDIVAYEPGLLEWGKTYYWRIDEIDDANPESPWKGAVWSLSTAGFIVVDDFESYTDDNQAGEAIYQTWIDGWENGTGSLVGYLETPFAEQTIVSAGRQSMPLEYNNIGTPWYSEADRTWAVPQNWTANGVKALTLHFRGSPVGFVETTPGNITMSGAGADIYLTTDEFRFAYKQLNGDGSITARIEGIENTHEWAKAGVMIRAGLEPAGVQADIIGTPTNRVEWMYRDTPGADTSAIATAVDATPMPHWVRIMRQGNTITAEHSADGATWDRVTSDTGTSSVDLSLPTDVYIGLAVTSHVSGVPALVEFSNVETTGNVTGPWQVAEIGVDHPGNDPGQLYVAVEDSAGRVAIVNHPNPDAVLLGRWQEWNIPLSDFAAVGVNLGGIKAMHIGVGDPADPLPGGAGRLHIDEIRVYKPRCVPSMARPDNDFNDDCVVDYRDFELMAEQWLSVGTDVASLVADVNADSRVDLADFTRLANTWQDEQLWP